MKNIINVYLKKNKINSKNLTKYNLGLNMYLVDKNHANNE